MLSKLLSNQLHHHRLILSSTSMMHYTTLKERLAKKKKVETPSNSAASALMQDIGLRSYIKKVYTTTGASVAGALTLSSIACSSGLAFTNPGLCLFGGIASSIIGMIGFNTSQSEIVWENVQGVDVMASRNSLARQMFYGLACGGLGLSMAPFFGVYTALSPALLPASILLTSTVCAGASLYAYMKPRGSLLWLQGPIFGSLCGLFALQLVGLGSGLIWGPSAFTAAIHSFDLYFGTALFTAFVAYDTHQAILMYEQGNPDHLAVSFNFFLNFMNLLRRIMEILYRMNE